MADARPLAALIMRSWTVEDERVYPVGASAPDPGGLAEVAAEAILALPIEQRMEFMGMEPLIVDERGVAYAGSGWREKE